ncbi:M20/M25/M40 family metallo-hydrolase [Halocalculus aciditolerans]|uniref:Endoglucanase n=1 Tax=Halocalculus aciditolerans TaxID=1383812 RepID=A0A830F9I9_9EURY|nr:M20/M25/M40 family metallo-hydrolase [Halocalculus aciditolerans]GGL53380.1 endoglucanase [Halocalculus aciditolerans]
MEDAPRAFLDDLLSTASPSGFETAAQSVWLEYVSAFADDVTTDAYGNAVAVYEGDEAGPELAFAGHADEIGLMVAEIDDDGFVRLTPIGGADRTVSLGRHVRIHTDDGPVNGVVGQAAIHLRMTQDDPDAPKDIGEQYVDIGAESEEEARELVEVGDPITIAEAVDDLQGTRVAARGMDNRIGIWTAAEALRRAADRGVDATVYAVSTVQEEVGLNGAEMVGFDLDPDAYVAIDVTHATDHPVHPGDTPGEVELGSGPVVARGATNHVELVRAVRDAAGEADIDVQLQANGIRTGTDADAVFTQRGGIPAMNLGVPNRYMHTPAEIIDTGDLDAAADLLAAVADSESDREDFRVDL